MTSTRMGGTGGLRAVVVARDPIVRRSLVRMLRECRIPASEWLVEELVRGVPDSHVVCTGPSGATAVLAIDVPAVIVTRGFRVSDEVWAELLRRRPALVRYGDLTPATLLEALLRARFGVDLSEVPASLSSVPPAVLRAFFRSPGAVGTIREFSRASGLTVDELRATEKELGHSRFEGLATQLRAAVYKWLVCAGIDRRAVEEYLGIEDRSHFYRACRRAKSAVPWRRR